LAATHESNRRAVATLQRGKDIAVDAGEIVLLADARIGEFTREMPHGKPKPGSTAKPGSAPKRDALAAEGLTRKQAAECDDARHVTASCAYWD
jgi:hypothetical protein